MLHGLPTDEGDGDCSLVSVLWDARVHIGPNKVIIGLKCS